MPFEPTPLSRRLRALREGRNWSRPAAVSEALSLMEQSGLSTAKRLTTEALRSYERGVRPPADTMLVLSRLYDVGYSDLSLTGLPGGVA